MAGLRSCWIDPITGLLLMLVGISGLTAAGLQPGERLDYTFSYRGVFSGFIQIDIAHASFVMSQQPLSLGGQLVYQAGMELTTEPFRKAELIYPIRYRYRSWLEADHQTPRLVQEYLHTDEIEEELLLFDREQGVGFRYHKAGVSSAQETRPPALLLHDISLDPTQWSLAEGAHREPLPAPEVWDYLSLLYRLRFGELTPGTSFELPVYNGKQIKTYRTQVTQERLVWAGWDLTSFKLNLFEVRDGKRKGDSVTSIWISDDAWRRPLRFHVERGFGVFEGVLETGRPMSARGDEFSEATRKSLELVF